jgi:hypothetical protein
VFHLTGSQWIIYGALSVVWAFMGYRLSENDRKILGRTPWGLPSAVWALFWFLSLLVGLVLYLIAHSVGVRQAQRNPSAMNPGGTGTPASMEVRAHANRQPTAAEQFPAYPRPANFQPDSDEDDSVEAVETSDWGEADQAPDFTANGQVSPPAWHPDPSGRFHYRWWDGSEWTSQVSSDGHHLIDTNPDQRIGPY